MKQYEKSTRYPRKDTRIACIKS